MRIILVGFFTGLLLTLSWVIFIDGQVNSNDAFPPLHILPPLIATIASVLINFVSVNKVAENLKAKIWLFLMVTIQCICIGTSIFILSTQYSITDNYAGVSILIQTILVMIASFLFFIGQRSVDFI